MASVLDYIECPNCKHEATDDFYYKTGEEYVNCQHCGYHRSVTIINREKRLDLLLESDWKIVEIKDPYGAYSINYFGTEIRHCGTLENQEQLEELKTNCFEEDAVEYVEVSRYLNGKIKVEKIVNKKGVIIL
jgi:DNA-directed RNA polymerase subunit RPC12/RpoP